MTESEKENESSWLLISQRRRRHIVRSQKKNTLITSCATLYGVLILWKSQTRQVIDTNARLALTSSTSNHLSNLHLSVQIIFIWSCRGGCWVKRSGGQTGWSCRVRCCRLRGVLVTRASDFSTGTTHKKSTVQYCTWPVNATQYPLTECAADAQLCEVAVVLVIRNAV